MKQILLIEAKREFYGMDQIRGTMTAGELIELLSEYDEDTPVAISNDNGYTYGRIRYNDISWEDVEDEDEDWE